MDGYSWVVLITLITTVVAVWMIRKPKEYKYAALDISGIILNTVLIIMIYPPLSVAGALLGINLIATEPLFVFLNGITIAMGRLMPAISVAGIGASIILRRKEKRTLSFLIQFAGGIWYCITMLFAMLCGSYN